MAERISRKRAIEEGWLSVQQIREATALGHATLMERLKNASRDGLRAARLENGEWRLHRDDLARLPRRYEARGAPRSRLEALAVEVQDLRARVFSLEAALAARRPQAVAPDPTPLQSRSSAGVQGGA